MDGWRERREGKCGGDARERRRGGGLSGSCKYLYCIMIRETVKRRRVEGTRGTGEGGQGVI